MPLDCAMFDDVTFIGVEKTPKPISIRSGEIYYYLTEFGTWSSDENAKCVIFPKGKTTWEGFQRPFKDGDILYIDCNDDEDTYKQYQYTFILNEISDGKIYCYCYIDEVNINKKFEICWLANMTTYTPRFATEEEKQRLFDAIKANGYKWNAETKTLEKLIVPKFKVGDRIKWIKTGNIHEIIKILSNCYITNYLGSDITILFDRQDEYELVHVEPKFKVGDRIRYAGEDFPIKIIDIKNNQYHIECFCDKYNDYKNGIIPVSEQNNYILIPKFNPKTLKPFDKVLVRDFNNQKWMACLFSHIDNDAHHQFKTIDRSGWYHCIPFNDGTKHLVGKIDDAPEFYRYWEE